MVDCFRTFFYFCFMKGYSCILISEDANETVHKKKKTLCLACARDTRGKYKLTKFSDKQQFFCDANKG